VPGRGERCAIDAPRLKGRGTAHLAAQREGGGDPLSDAGPDEQRTETAVHPGSSYRCFLPRRCHRLRRPERAGRGRLRQCLTLALQRTCPLTLDSPDKLAWQNRHSPDGRGRFTSESGRRRDLHYITRVPHPRDRGMRRLRAHTSRFVAAHLNNDAPRAAAEVRKPDRPSHGVGATGSRTSGGNSACA
jgi:hypothetical protein